MTFWLCAEPLCVGALPTLKLVPALVRCTALHASARMPRGLALGPWCIALLCVCLTLPCRYFDSLLHVGIVLQDLCQHSCLVLHLFCTLPSLHCTVAIAAEHSDSDLVFRFTCTALPCLAQHVQPRNGFAMPDEQRPRGASGGLQRPYGPPARAAAGRHPRRTAQCGRWAHCTGIV